MPTADARQLWILRASIRAWSLVLILAAGVVAFVVVTVAHQPAKTAPLPPDLSGIPADFEPTLPPPTTTLRGPSVTAVRTR